MFEASGLQQFLGFGQRSLLGGLIPGAVYFRPLEKIHQNEPGQAATARGLIGHAGSRSKMKTDERRVRPLDDEELRAILQLERRDGFSETG